MPIHPEMEYEAEQYIRIDLKTPKKQCLLGVSSEM